MVERGGAEGGRSGEIEGGMDKPKDGVNARDRKSRQILRYDGVCECQRAQIAVKWAQIVTVTQNPEIEVRNRSDVVVGRGLV
jgi:hypothetical protein